MSVGCTKIGVPLVAYYRCAPISTDLYLQFQLSMIYNGPKENLKINEINSS
jgi:hypothetical protein